MATLRHNRDCATLTQQFHRQRVEQLFYHFARIGRDFYAQEQRWQEEAFWAARRAWPDTQPLHAVVTPDTVNLTRRPVVREGRIAEEEVVVTPDHPLGVWHVDGITVAPMLAALREQRITAQNPCAAESLLVGQFALPLARAVALLSWMKVQGWWS